MTVDEFRALIWMILSRRGLRVVMGRLTTGDLIDFYQAGLKRGLRTGIEIAACTTDVGHEVNMEMLFELCEIDPEKD